jgi:hypothetical protein
MVNEPEKLPSETGSALRVFSFLLNAGSLLSVLRADQREASLRREAERFWFFLS